MPEILCNCPATSRPKCSNCQSCKQHCTCIRCEACALMYFKDTICINCNYCADDCTCRCCEKCNAVKFKNDVCSKCIKCSDTCCVCYVCTACKIDFKEQFHTRPTTTPPALIFCIRCVNCVDHCTCGLCRPTNGDARHSCSPHRICQTCGCCNYYSHCNCVGCEFCNRKHTKRNETSFHLTNNHYEFEGEEACLHCFGCCRCGMTGVDFRKGKFQLHSSVFSKGEFKQNPLRRHISVEMEVDGCSRSMRSFKVNTALDNWGDAVVHDGSLAAEGFEINTTPTDGDRFLKHIKELCHGLEVIKGFVSSRCGLHVHVNVKGTPLLDADGKQLKDPDGNGKFDPRNAYTHYDLRRLVLLYYRIESAMFMLCKPERMTSRYSKPCGKFYITKQSTPKEFRKDVIAKFYRGGRPLPVAPTQPQPRPSIFDSPRLRGTGSQFKAVGNEIRAHKQQKYTDVRYYALNLHSFFMRGTVEFRHKEGTIDFNEVTNWALICGHVVDAASRLSEKEIRALPKDAKEALLAILPDNLKQYAERKWAAQEETIPRLKQLISETWAGHSPENF